MLKTVLASMAIMTAPIATTASATIQLAGTALGPGAGGFPDLLAPYDASTCQDRPLWSLAGAPEGIPLSGGTGSYVGDLPGDDIVLPALSSGPIGALNSTPLLGSPPSEIGDIATEEIAEPGALALLAFAVIGLALAWAIRRARRLRKAA